MYAMISYGIYTVYDTIRNYNLFDLQSTLFGKVKPTDSTQFGIVLALCLWMIYSLLVFEGIQFIDLRDNFDSRHYITIALLTLLWLVFTFSYSQKSQSVIVLNGNHVRRNNTSRNLPECNYDNCDFIDLKCSGSLYSFVRYLEI